MFKSSNMSRRLSMSRKLPKIRMSKSILTNILYVITLVLAINFIMKNQISALLSLFLIAGLVYYFMKNVTLALIVSIIATNLLIATKYLGGPKMEQFIKSKQGMTGSKTIDAFDGKENMKAKDKDPVVAKSTNSTNSTNSTTTN